MQKDCACIGKGIKWCRNYTVTMPMIPHRSTPILYLPHRMCTTNLHRRRRSVFQPLAGFLTLIYAVLQAVMSGFQGCHRGLRHTVSGHLAVHPLREVPHPPPLSRSSYAWYTYQSPYRHIRSKMWLRLLANNLDIYQTHIALTCYDWGVWMPARITHACLPFSSTSLVTHAICLHIQIWISRPGIHSCFFHINFAG